MFLEVQILDPADYVFRVAELAQNVPGFLRVKLLQRRAPLQITGAGHRIRVARDFPAAQVLAARRQTQRLGRVRAKAQHPVA